MNRKFCDHCKNEINEAQYFSLSGRLFIINNEKVKANKIDKDYCNDCFINNKINLNIKELT